MNGSIADVFSTAHDDGNFCEDFVVFLLSQKYDDSRPVHYMGIDHRPFFRRRVPAVPVRSVCPNLTPANAQQNYDATYGTRHAW